MLISIRYIIEEEHYKYKNTIENRERCNDNNTYSAFNKFAKSISNYKSLEEEKRE